MFLIQTEVRESCISGAGQGLFALETVKKGTVVYLPTINFERERLLLEADHNAVADAGDDTVLDYSHRWVGHYFLYSHPHKQKLDHINHSEDANLLYHCGIAFSKREINAGDELTADYQSISPYNWTERFDDRLVGMPAKEALLHTTQQLLDLLNQIDDIHCHPVTQKQLDAEV